MNRRRNKTDRIAAVLLMMTLLFNTGFRPHSDEAQSNIPDDKGVVIFAAAGTTAAVQHIAAAYEKQTGCRALANFSASSTLAKQIAAGAAFDVYISANPSWMDFVETKKLIDPASRQDLLSDRLALIAPAGKNSNLKKQSIRDILLNSTGSIAIGDPTHVPVGAYTKEALRALDCWSEVEERLIPAHTVRAAQQLVETGQCELGIVYRAGAVQSHKVQMLGLFEESWHSPVRFSAAAAPHSLAGRKLLGFLTSPEAAGIFSDAGFTVISPDRPPAPISSTALTSLPPAFAVNEWQVLSISVKVAAACVLVVAAPGILLGYLLASRSFPGRSLINACVHLPMVIPPVVTGYLALMLLGKNSLLGGMLEKTVGLSFAFNRSGAVLVAAVMGFPLLVRSVKTAVEMVDSRYRQAAGILGAGPVRAFCTITLPLAAPGICAGMVLAFARSLGEFGATAVFVGNIPGKTQTLSLAIYNFMQIPGAESSAMRLVMISVTISFAAMLGSEILLKKLHTMNRLGA